MRTTITSAYFPANSLDDHHYRMGFKVETSWAFFLGVVPLLNRLPIGIWTPECPTYCLRLFHHVVASRTDLSSLQLVFFNHIAHNVGMLTFNLIGMHTVFNIHKWRHAKNRDVDILAISFISLSFPRLRVNSHEEKMAFGQVSLAVIFPFEYSDESFW